MIYKRKEPEIDRRARQKAEVFTFSTRGRAVYMHLEPQL